MDLAGATRSLVLDLLSHHKELMLRTFTIPLVLQCVDTML